MGEPPASELDRIGLCRIGVWPLKGFNDARCAGPDPAALPADSRPKGVLGRLGPVGGSHAVAHSHEEGAERKQHLARAFVEVPQR